MWFVLALLSAFALASADAVVKRDLSHASGLELLLVRFMLPGLLLLPVIFFIDFSTIAMEMWYLMPLLVALEIIAMYFYVIAIRDAPLHLTIPFLSFTPVFVILTGWLFLGEKVTSSGVIGIVLITAGTWLLGVRDGYRVSIRSLFQPIHAILQCRQSIMMILVACIYAFTSTLSKKAMLHMNPEVFGAFYFVMVGAGTLLVVTLLRPASFRMLKTDIRASLLVAILMAIMVVVHFMAIARVEAAYMIAVKRTSLLFGLIYGYYLFHDERIRQNLVAGTLMVVGVGIIVLT